ncbi:MAG: hypothetical protein ACRD2Q_10755 [Terriglobales bacterium]
MILLTLPDSGTVEGNTYANPSVGVSLSFPGTWKPLRVLAGGYTSVRGFDKLFAAGESPDNWLLVSTLKLSVADTGRLTAYLLRDQLRNAEYTVEPKTAEIKVGSKKLFRLSYTGAVGQTPFHCALFITGHNKSVLLFEFCASNKPALDSALTTVQSLNFTKAKKEK